MGRERRRWQSAEEKGEEREREREEVITFVGGDLLSISFFPQLVTRFFSLLTEEEGEKDKKGVTRGVCVFVLSKHGQLLQLGSIRRKPGRDGSDREQAEQKQKQAFLRLF